VYDVISYLIYCLFLYYTLRNSDSENINVISNYRLAYNGKLFTFGMVA